ncbi:MAG: bacteriohemerythrin [Chloroflexota bacterium]
MAKKLFDFDAEFKLGIEVIDAEHVKLVDMLNQVHFLLSEGKKDDARRYFNETLSAYVDEHFANEEKFMESIGFPLLEEHRKIHENFKKSFQELKPQIELYDDVAFRKALSDAFGWIVAHIGRTDRRYAKFYLENAG